MTHSVVKGRMKARDNEERKMVVNMKIVRHVACGEINSIKLVDFYNLRDYLTS